MSPHLPVTAKDIADQTRDAAQAGAAILHLHACQQGTGRPTQGIAEYEKFMPIFRDGCDAIINITTWPALAFR